MVSTAGRGGRTCARAIALIVLLLLTVASSAHGQPSSTPSEADMATAREIAKDAFAAYDRKDYVTAEQLFERASKLYEAPTLLLGLARCRVQVGKLVKASENYNRIIRMQLPPDATPAFVDAQRAAHAELREIEPRLGWVTITLQGAAASRVTVSIDGAAIPAEAIGVRRPVDPGTHQLQAQGAGYKTFQTTFSAGQGTAQTVPIRMSTTGGSPLPVVGFVLLGVGAAGLIVGAAAGGIAVSQHRELSDKCVDNRCEADQYDTLDSFQTTSTVSTAALIIGGAVAATGLTLVIVHYTGAGGSASTGEITLGPAALGVRGSF